MPLYVYTCERGHRTTRVYPVDRRDEAPPCGTCSAGTTRVLYPGDVVANTKDHRRSAAMALGRDRILKNSPKRDPDRAPRTFLMDRTS
jgi:hypothetical protein